MKLSAYRCADCGHVEIVDAMPTWMATKGCHRCGVVGLKRIGTVAIDPGPIREAPPEGDTSPPPTPDPAEVLEGGAREAEGG